MHEALFALPPVYGAADRLWGADKPAFKGKKAVIAALVMGGGYLIAGVTGLLFGLAWFVWRAVPFFGGSSAPQTTGERLAAVLRNAPVVGPAALIAYWRGLPEPQTAGVFVIWAACAVGLAIFYGERTLAAKQRGVGIGNLNTFIEVGRGVTFGIAALVVLSFGG